jgi:hypothetical protein
MATDIWQRARRPVAWALPEVRKVGWGGRGRHTLKSPDDVEDGYHENLSVDLGVAEEEYQEKSSDEVSVVEVAY